MENAPSRPGEPYDQAYGLPARLHEAGVQFAITGEAGPAIANRLPFEAGAAIAFGLPEDEAVRPVPPFGRAGRLVFTSPEVDRILYADFGRHGQKEGYTRVEGYLHG